MRWDSVLGEIWRGYARMAKGPLRGKRGFAYQIKELWESTNCIITSDLFAFNSDLQKSRVDLCDVSGFEAVIRQVHLVSPVLADALNQCSVASEADVKTG